MLFLDLPEDIIENVILFLPPDAIKSLSATCKPLNAFITNSSYVWQQLFIQTFGRDPTPYTMNKWPDLYSMRSKGKLFTWGSMNGGRLGLNSKDIPTENLVRRGFQSGVGRPSQVPQLEGYIVASVSCGGFSTQILTSKGEIYTLGNWHSGHNGPGPDTPDFNRLRAMERDRSSGVPPPPDLRYRLARVTGFPPFNTGRLGGTVLNPTIMPVPMPDLPTSPFEPPNVENEGREMNRFIHKEFCLESPDAKFVSVSSGRCHFVALDNAGNIWSWDDPRTAHGVNIQFIGPDGKNLISEGHKVLQCIAGWDSSVAYLYNYGLVYWRKRTALGENDHFALAHHQLVPGTGEVNGNNKVVDFIVGDGFLVYLTADGGLYRNDMIGEVSFPLIKFQGYLKKNAQSLQPKFTRLSGNFSTFACFTNEDIVLIGSRDIDEPQIIEELQHRGCISIAVGDYHFLALCEDGSLYTWGLESQTCGCLGLGLDPEGSIREGNGTRIRKPTLIPTEGKVIAISAAGWQSSAIITT